MADSKITALTSIGASTDPANDPLVLVDVSDTSMAASGTTKKVTLNQLLGASGTATLASATITGDLTVDTNTLKVDSANNRVGIVKTTPAYPLDVGGRISYSGAIGEGADTTVSSIGTSLLFGNAANWSECQFFAGGNLQHRMQSAGVFTWLDGAGGTRMTLNSTGLGIGTASVTSGFKLDVVNGDFRVSDAAGADGVEIGWSAGSSQGFVQAYNRNTSAFKPLLLNSSLLVDTSGNVGVGVTPSGSGGCLQLKSGITFPATQVASSDANTLDDYEEGTWTPTVGDASSGGNQGTTATAVGRYTKIGRLVTVQFELTDIDTTGLTAGNSLYIRGLPFTASSATTQYGTITGAGITFSGFLTCGVYNSTAFPIYQTSSGGSLADIKVSGFASGTADIWGTLTYIV